MLALMVLAFVLIDLTMLTTYTIVIRVFFKDDLSAKVVINAENPDDVEGVSYLIPRLCC